MGKRKEGVVGFGELLEKLPEGSGGPGPLSDISVHMAFICVLHLANENGLAISGAESLREMKIKMPL